MHTYEVDKMLKKVLNKETVEVIYSYKGKAKDFSKDKIKTTVILKK